MKEFRYSSKKGFFFVVFSGQLFTWMIEVGRFSISFARPNDYDREI